MRIEKAHDFDLEEATRRMAALADYWSAKYGAKPDWQDNKCLVSGKVFGFGFHASLEVRQGQIICEGPNPPLLVRKRIRKYLDHKLSQYLAKDRTVEELVALARALS